MGLKIGSLLLAMLMLQVLPSSTEDNSPHACCDGNNILGKNGCQGNKNLNKFHVKLQCDKGMFGIDPSVDPSDEFTVTDDGILVFGNGSHQIEKGKYCIAKRNIIKTTDESMSISSGTEYEEMALVCFEDPDDSDISLTYTVTGSLIITSVFFLILTLIVYFLVSELRDLQGKCIMCTCVSLSLGFLLLAITQLFMHSLNGFCTFIAFFTYYWMLTIFFWMNVVSINVWRSVACRKSTISETRLFQIYNLYGWGVPLLFLLTAFITHHADGNHIKPGFGQTSCWLSGNTATWAYFYGPIATLIIANIILFIITSLKLWNNTSYENVTGLRSMKFKFLLYLKLFLVMGISWTFEIISFIHDKSHIVWVIMDTFNCLQGIVFFLVLVVFRRRAIRGLVERGFLPQSWSVKGSKSMDEECDDILPEEEARSMVAA